MYSLSLIHKLIHIYPPPLDSPYDSSPYGGGARGRRIPARAHGGGAGGVAKKLPAPKTDQPDMGVGTPGGNRVCHLGGRRLLGRTRGHGRGDNDDHGLAPDYLYIDVIGLYLYIRLYTTIYLYVDMSNYVGVFTYLYITKKDKLFPKYTTNPSFVTNDDLYEVTKQGDHCQVTTVCVISERQLRT